MRPAVRNIVLSVLGWVSGVALLGGLTFVVVDLADQVVGGQVSADQGSAPGSPGSSASGATDAEVLDPDESGTSPGDAPRADGEPAQATGPEVTAEPGAPTPTAGEGTETQEGTGTQPADPGAGPPATVPPTPDGPSATPTPTPTLPEPLPQAAVFPGEGGTVVAACRGQRITVVSITVRDGWAFAKDVPARGPRAVVTFSRVADRAVVTLEVTCVRGAPKKSGGSAKKPGAVDGVELPSVPLPLPLGVGGASDASS